MSDILIGQKFQDGEQIYEIKRTVGADVYCSKIVNGKPQKGRSKRFNLQRVTLLAAEYEKKNRPVAVETGQAEIVSTETDYSEPTEPVEDISTMELNVQEGIESLDVTNLNEDGKIDF